MTASKCKQSIEERSIDTLRCEADDVRDSLRELADALEDDEADEALVAETYQQLSYAGVAIEDAADGVIDANADRWRAVDALRAGLYHAADAIRLEESDSEIISPTVERGRRAALRWATSAAEYLAAE